MGGEKVIGKRENFRLLKGTLKERMATQRRKEKKKNAPESNSRSIRFGEEGNALGKEQIGKSLRGEGKNEKKH